ncbi:zinc finger protein 277-like [Artemia franciscana]|nr:hypothetical protein QYM36_003118 [Artemia franciscana]KAK2722810.1 hypothetical protein QYM36_003118 [Artemia franciscana]KAK2722811.1 hypothetical protein QYM36_003118 [Artemia franciscana]KAK2722814.1 hypothetical protein QYM36_003118 [Artemia franciscana]KAK2722815.1 hypothetical protein QYM36_003118 [Artemia franciscana]
MNTVVTGNDFKTDSPILEPLTFKSLTLNSGRTSRCLHPELPCILKSCMFSSRKIDELNSHIMVNHRLLVADVKVIPDFLGYFQYWKEKMTEETIPEYCYGIKALVGTEEGSKTEEKLFYMLSDSLPEDKDLRLRLQKQVLEDIIRQVEIERTDSIFTRRCLFCNTVFTGNRAILFEHLRTKHNLFLGNPDNIVYSYEFLDLIEEKLKRLLCLYCENVFKSREVLLEHMRKKGHKHLNPDNHEYDQFYVINYAELGKTWHDFKDEISIRGNYTCHETAGEIRIVREMDSESEDWSDWEEAEQDLGAVCFFCNSKFTDINKFESHLKVDHNFDFHADRKKLNLDFYQQVKLVNYIRRQMHQRRCIYCSKEFKTKLQVDMHMDSDDHRRIPAESIWDQTEYFFPTYEDDFLLQLLEDNDVKTSDRSPRFGVIPEDVIVPTSSVLLDESFRRELEISGT